MATFPYNCLTFKTHWTSLKSGKQKSQTYGCEGWLSIMPVCKCNAHLVRVMFSYECGDAIVDNSPCVVGMYKKAANW